MLSRLARISASAPLRVYARLLSTAAAGAPAPSSGPPAAPTTLAEAAKARVLDAAVVSPLAAAAVASAGTASASAVAEALWAAAQLNVTDADVIAALAAAATSAASTFDATSCGAAAWGGATLRVSDIAFWRALSGAAARVLDAGKGKPITPAVAAQLLTAHHLGPVSNGSGTFLTSASVAACAAALPAPAAGLAPSSLELQAALSELGYESKRVLGLGGLVDVPLLIGATGLGPTAVEMDGPAAFLGVASARNSMQTGETRARTRLLREALGVAVVRVPWWHWAALGSNQDRLRYLAARIQGTPQDLVFTKTDA